MALCSAEILPALINVPEVNETVGACRRKVVAIVTKFGAENLATMSS